jgi:hypothetical protein
VVGASSPRLVSPAVVPLGRPSSPVPVTLPSRDVLEGVGPLLVPVTVGESLLRLEAVLPPPLPTDPVRLLR